MASNTGRLALVVKLFHKLNREHFHSSIPTPKIRLSRRMTTSAGSVEYGSRQQVLTISIPYHDHYGWEGELLSTLKHEMIHLYLARYHRIRGHGKTFSALCAAIGTERFCKELPRRGPTYIYECPRCGTEYRYRKTVRFYCGPCHANARSNGSLLRMVRMIPARSNSQRAGQKAGAVSGGAARSGRQLSLPGLQKTSLNRRAARHRKKTRKRPPPRP
ncbi:MAG: SprT family zinc-dependent metalloprotease [Nitrospinota bacterium]